MTDRARYLGFAACLGAGLALLIYRFAVLGFMWDGPAKNVLQIGAPVLIVVGSQLVRGVQDKTKPWLLMIVTAVVGGSVAWGVCTQAVPGLARARLAQRELPGFSIGLPSGKTTDNITYSQGRVEITAVAGTGSVVEVQWEAGALFSPDEMSMFASGMAGSLGGTTATTPAFGTGPDGAKTISMQLNTPKGPLYVTAIGCGARRIMVMSGGDDALEKLQERMVASIACHPDKAKETAVGTLPWTVTLPAGWFQMPAQAGQVQLTDGNNALLARGLERMPDRSELPKMMESLMAAAGQKMSVAPWSGDRFPVQGSFDGTPVAGWLLPIECHGQAVLVMGFAADSAGSDALFQLVTTKGRCLAPGETAPPWPTKP